MNNIKRIKELTVQLNKYRDLYYNDSNSIISDYEYDNLFDELKKLEEESGIVMCNSPTQSVGYEIKSELKKHKHSHQMLSLDKTKSINDLVSFSEKDECILMHKLDGLTILLTYENGELSLAETRGNAEEGEIITHNAKVFKNIPLTIPCKEHFEIEGEAIITYSDFESINSRLPDDKKYKNPRNLVSGSARQLDSNIAAKRNIRFITWKVATDLGETYTKRFMKAEEFGFDVVPFIKVCKFDKCEDYEKYTYELKKLAEDFGYPIDGLVSSYNNIKYGISLGTTGHHPKHSVAYKFYDEEVETELLDIDWTMGKTGILTPTAVFKPVEIDGTVVERASLHNVSILDSLQLLIGDRITVYKANQIIPQIRENLTVKYRKIETSIEQMKYEYIPETCPFCESVTSIKKDNNSKTLICINNTCKGKLLGKLNHFVSKNAISIEGLSESTLEKFIENGFLNSFADIYKLKSKYEYIINMDGFGKKSADKLMNSIDKSRDTSLDRFIYSLSIPLIGRTASRTINNYFCGDYDSFLYAWKCGFDWTSLEDFGSNMYTSMAKYILEESEIVDDLALYMNFQKKEKITSIIDLSNKIFVITGSFNIFNNRDEAKDKIESLGGKVSGSVSKRTSYLVNNDIESTSGKNKKAKELGVTIITEDQLIKMMQ